jgi:hypothetical protein
MTTVGDWLAHRMAAYINDAMSVGYNVLGNYYTGDHRPQLKVKQGTKDDNIIQNFVGLAVDRSVSRLWRGGVEFKLPEGADEQEKYLKRVWELNKKPLFQYQEGLHGSIYGTYYAKIRPEGVTDPYTGDLYPALIPLDPEIIRVQTDPQDQNYVKGYRIEYTVRVPVDEFMTRDVSYREIIRRGEGEGESPDTWIVENWEQQEGGLWQMVDSTVWPYDFPPVMHGKNLPSLKSCYGDSDIDDAINVQDKSNFVVSNTGKIIKHHASPKTIGTGFSIAEMKPLDDSPDSMWAIPSKDAKLFNLEIQSDLASSRAFAQDLRQSIFDISREVDISSMADKLGALTNFGLHVLWSDALDKNDTKRQLYGDFLLELNRRLLVLAGFTGPASDPGRIVWGEPLPVNVLEDMQTDQLALDMGIIDKGTVAERYKYRYGKTWEEIQEAQAEEQTAANQGNADIGSLILRNFSQGQGAELPAPPTRQPVTPNA